MSDETSPLLQILVDESRSIQRFVDLLNLEQIALKSGETDSLPDFADQKSQLAATLNNLAEQRDVLLSSQGFGADRKGFDAWRAKHSKEQTIADTWSGILKLAMEARELNRLNGELIRLRLSATAKALQALQAGKNSLDLYGPDGQSTSTGQRRIDHAV